MAHTHRPRVGLRCSAGFLAALLAFPVPSWAFETPLSDTAIREAYFLGQRHDETYADFMNRYTRYLAPPKSGPVISSVTLFTHSPRSFSFPASVPPAIAPSRRSWIIAAWRNPSK